MKEKNFKKSEIKKIKYFSANYNLLNSLLVRKHTKSTKNTSYQLLNK